MDYQHFLEESLACGNFLAEIELHRFGDIKVQKISHKLVEKVFVFLSSESWFLFQNPKKQHMNSQLINILSKWISWKRFCEQNQSQNDAQYQWNLTSDPPKFWSLGSTQSTWNEKKTKQTLRSASAGEATREFSAGQCNNLINTQLTGYDEKSRINKLEVRKPQRGS